MPKGSVKIMLSYDYCHFEVCLSSDKNMTLKKINETRKDAQRLADEAVRQYKVAKNKAELKIMLKHERMRLENDVKMIKEKPLSERTPEEKAKIKALRDKEYWKQYDYDYEDDYEI